MIEWKIEDVLDEETEDNKEIEENYSEGTEESN